MQFSHSFWTVSSHTNNPSQNINLPPLPLLCPSSLKEKFVNWFVHISMVSGDELFQTGKTVKSRGKSFEKTRGPSSILTTLTFRHETASDSESTNCL